MKLVKNYTVMHMKPSGSDVQSIATEPIAMFGCNFQYLSSETTDWRYLGQVFDVVQ